MKKKKKEKRTLKYYFKYYIWSKRNLFTWIWEIVKSFFFKVDLFHANGSHLISGYPGSGKTLKMNQIIGEVDKNKYFFISNLKEFDGVKTFNLKEIFGKGQQLKSFPTEDEKGRKLYGVIFDEINREFNRRNNRQKEYNDAFTGLIEFLVSHRHQDVPRVYFIGQKLELQDVQLQCLFKYQHDIIRTTRRPKYWFYKDNKHLEFIPTKLDIVNRVKSIDDEFIELNCVRCKITRENLETYNTKALADEYKQLPKLTLN